MHCITWAVWMCGGLLSTLHAAGQLMTAGFFMIINSLTAGVFLENLDNFSFFSVQIFLLQSGQNKKASSDHQKELLQTFERADLFL